MKILLVNDDGIMADGLQALAKVLCHKHKVYIVAPLHEQSGMSQALTLNHNILVYKKDLNIGESLAYAVDGTPADCVKIGLESLLLDEDIDLVISGVNNGYNLGTDVIYSGTVGAATEGYVHGVNAVAISKPQKCKIATEEINALVEKFIEQFFIEKMDKPLLFNVNFPPRLNGDAKFSISEQGFRHYNHEFHIREVEDGIIEYGIKGKAIDLPNRYSTDIAAIDRGEIAVTPLMINRTDFQVLEQIKK